MKLECVVDKKSFVDNKTEKAVRYYEFAVVLDGQRIPLKPVENKKAVSNYILDKIFKD